MDHKQQAPVGRIEAFQGLKALAFFMVFLSHLDCLSSVDPSAYDLFGSRAGSVGVAVFIMLSGFTTAYSHKEGSYDLRQIGVYTKRKIAAVYPLHIVTLLFVAAIDIVLHTATVRELLVRLVPQLLLVHAFIPDRSFYFSFNYVSWYLCLYAFFSVIALPLLRFLRTRRHKGTLVLILVGILLFDSAYLAVCDPLPDKHWLTYICPLFRALDYAVGMILGLLFVQSRQKPLLTGWRGTAGEIAAIAMLLGLLPLGAVTLLGQERLIYTIICGACIYIFAMQSGAVSRLLGSKPFLWIGKHSLSCFLFHQIAIKAAERIASGHALLVTLLSIAGTLAACIVWDKLTGCVSGIRTKRLAAKQ